MSGRDTGSGRGHTRIRVKSTRGRKVSSQRWLERQLNDPYVSAAKSKGYRSRAAIGPIGADRADLVLPGCAIFAAIHALWPCAQLRVADRGLREGMLRRLLKEAAP